MRSVHVAATDAGSGRGRRVGCAVATRVAVRVPAVGFVGSCVEAFEGRGRRGGAGGAGVATAAVVARVVR